MSTAADQLLEDVRTTEEVAILTDEIDVLLEALYHSNKEAFGHALKANVRQSVAERIDKIFPDFESGEERQKLRAVFEDLKKKFGELEILKIETPLAATEETITLVSEWVRSNVGRNVIIALGIDKSLLGARFTFRGRYKEVTLESFIAEAVSRRVGS